MDKYEINAQKLRDKLSKSNPGGYTQWRNKKRYSEDIFAEDETSGNVSGVKAEGFDDDELEVNEEIYGKSTFIPEYPLPKHELTYTTDGGGDIVLYEDDDENYTDCKENIIAIRPESRFMKKEYWPKAVIESDEFKKTEDESIFRQFGVDVDNDEEMQRELLAEVPKTSLYTDEQCWQIEEDWRMCKLMVRQGKAKSSECKKLLSDMKMCRGLAVMSRLKAL